MLLHVGFGKNIVQWLMWCVTTSLILIVLNKVPTMPVLIERSLRQGDPISSLLFIIVVECMSFIFNDAISKGLISYIPIGHDNVLISQLQYADDTLIFLH